MNLKLFLSARNNLKNVCTFLAHYSVTELIFFLQNMEKQEKCYRKMILNNFVSKYFDIESKC